MWCFAVLAGTVPYEDRVVAGGDHGNVDILDDEAVEMAAGRRDLGCQTFVG